MSSQIGSVFNTYQKSRTVFAQQVADLATRAQNVSFLIENGSLPLLKPLLKDSVPGIQQAAAMAIARLASFSEEVAQQVIKFDMLPCVVCLIREAEKTSEGSELSFNAGRHLKKAACIILRSVAKHSSLLATEIIDCSGALDCLKECLEDFDPGVKEAACWAVGYISCHNDAPQLSKALVEANVVPLLLNCVMEPELSLKRVGISALTDIAKHDCYSAQAVVDANAVNMIGKLLLHSDAKVRKQAAGLMGQVSSHSVDLAEIIVDANVIADALVLLQDDDIMVRMNAAIIMREVTKHSIELARLVVNSGGIQALVDLLSYNREKTWTSESLCAMKLPAIMCLGYISGFSETLAAAVISSKGVEAMKPFLTSGREDASLNCLSSNSQRSSVMSQSFTFLQAATAWTLGKVGSHSSEHAFSCAQNDVLRLLFNIYAQENGSKGWKKSSAAKPLAEASEAGTRMEEKSVEPGIEESKSQEVPRSRMKLNIPETVAEDLRNRAKTALKAILDKCTHLPALQALLTLESFDQDKRHTELGSVSTKPLSLKLVKIVLRQIAKVLPNDKQGKKAFVQGGALQFVQELGTKVSSEEYIEIAEDVTEINNCFPPQIVNYYSPKHAEELIKLIDDGEDEFTEESF